MFSRLLKDGLLLLAWDPVFDSVVSLIVGEPVRGSWWGHPRGHGHDGSGEGEQFGDPVTHVWSSRVGDWS